jgi:hypothetical protein
MDVSDCDGGHVPILRIDKLNCFARLSAVEAAAPQAVTKVFSHKGVRDAPLASSGRLPRRISLLGSLRCKSLLAGQLQSQIGIRPEKSASHRLGHLLGWIQVWKGVFHSQSASAVDLAFPG